MTNSISDQHDRESELADSPLEPLRQTSRPRFSEVYRDIDSDIKTNEQALAERERRIRENDNCFPQIGYVAFRQRAHIEKLRWIKQLQEQGHHTSAWVDVQEEGECTACACGLLVAGRVDRDFTESEFRKVEGHRTDGAWATRDEDDEEGES